MSAKASGREELGQPRWWTHGVQANAWTSFGTWMSCHFGVGLLLRSALGSANDDYVGFWGWFFLVSFAGAGYGYLRARQDSRAGMGPRPLTRTEGIVAGVSAVIATLTIWFTDNTSARMPGRYAVALLVLALMVADSLSRRHVAQ